ncbi:MAG: PorT family protein [Prevotella sp.]|nr:PorT family protein [Prevotella sp.]
MNKRIFTLTILTLAIALTSSAQYRPTRPAYPSRGVRTHSYYSRTPITDSYFGMRVGLGVATVNSDAPELDGKSARTGLEAGVAAGFQIVPASPLYFETGLYYTEKGGRSGSGPGKFTYSLDYLEVPLLLKYRYITPDRLSIEPFMGGYVACGVGGKIKNYGNRVAYSSFGDGAFRRFDAGLKLGCGLSYDIFYVGASYDIGLANIGQDLFDDTHTGCLNLTVGLNF